MCAKYEGTVIHKWLMPSFIKLHLLIEDINQLTWLIISQLLMKTKMKTTYIWEPLQEWISKNSV